MVGAISGVRPGRAETMTAPPPGTRAGMSRPKRDATAVARSPVEGTSCTLGPPGSAAQSAKKKEGIEPRPFHFPSDTPRCMRAAPMSVSSARRTIAGPGLHSYTGAKVSSRRSVLRLAQSIACSTRGPRRTAHTCGMAIAACSSLFPHVPREWRGV